MAPPLKRPAEPAVRPAAAADTPGVALLIGLDVGSTTVKAVVVEPVSQRILWQDYRRHGSRQAEKSLEFLDAIAAAFPDAPREAVRLFVTGSGGAALVEHIGGKFVQEVNAVSLAVEKLHPEVQSVVELGGQDAKIMVYKELKSGAKKKIPSMNDKCAGGTGAVIDKISAKLKISPARLRNMGYGGLALHPVAGKCGVFAETDINSLQKVGVPAEELMASLFESIVQQNLSVLARGHTLRPTVLLLGGPNTFIRGLRECWLHNLPRIWEERGIALPDPSRPAEAYIITPSNALYFAAIGAVEFGRAELEDDPLAGLYLGHAGLRAHLESSSVTDLRCAGSDRLVSSARELAAFKEQYRPEPWRPVRFQSGVTVKAFLGIDGGSTSTKGVLLDPARRVLAKAYRLSKGNPIEDTMEIIADLARQVRERGAHLEVLGVGTTGYAKDVLKDVLKADVALVETVAHTEACLHSYPGTDVIVDVGGQDIKLIVLKDGRVKDFKLNTQCSAGNGYFLQATAEAFGFDVREYADIAFSADAMPEFGYGCAVFMQSDIVDFQRRGWQPNEIMAGLAAVLPKNIWLYVAQLPNLARLGRRFVLQGGTQHNLAAVKAQVDFVRSRFHGTGTEPEIVVHRHCGESGAIGCALEAHRVWSEHGRKTRFIGIDRVAQIVYRTTQSEATRCNFCKNNCLRSFIDVHIGTDGGVSEASFESKVPLHPGHRRLIVASCEKGMVEDLDAMRRIKAALDEVAEQNPNFVALGARSAFWQPEVHKVAGPPPVIGPLQAFRRAAISRRGALVARRKTLRIGFPRVLNLYAQAPFFMAYFAALGVPPRNIVFSDYTDQALYKSGAKRGSIDPCFPSKLGIPHVHDLLHRQHKKKPLTHVFFPMVDSFPTFLDDVQAAKACPTAVATAEATHAAFIKEGDLFERNGIVFKKTFLNLDEPQLCARQMYEDWKAELGLSFEESLHAVREGLRALEDHEAALRRRSRDALDALERENRIGIVVLGRPYHNDPGVNHEILGEFQKRGYPVFWQDALPRDPDILDRLFGEEVRAGFMSSPLSIDDVWKNSYSEHTSRKLWAAKFTARHPNLVALELSSFKCGHDAPAYTVIEEIIERSGTPYFCFKDIDENKPVGSIKIRVETIAYFLDRYREQVFGEKIESVWGCVLAPA
ncbi:MAG: BadF/BadG/BcrA/BcrD ATPase family protein [Kiloniellales bacterium]|nr:BadF/BadG/BcrA/BcrD ATPase family protein [Kiloniellales bacterium]